MIIDQFRDIPDYPFDCYFADPAQFLHARRYWLALLGDTKGFVADSNLDRAALEADQAKAALGTLDRVVQVLRVTGFVASAPGFYEQPTVINGASDLLVAALGDAGRHTRSAIGVANLPLNTCVEIDAILKIR